MFYVAALLISNFLMEVEESKQAALPRSTASTGPSSVTNNVTPDWRNVM